MELVYLWVENYKNIQEESFHLSLKFECNYHKEKNQLTVNKKDDYLEEFFGKNINITAIVGENGSGKSSIIDIIQECVENNLYTEYILVFTGNDNVLKYISNIEIISNLQKGTAKELAQDIFIYNKNSHIHFPYRNYNIIKVDKKSIINMLITECDKLKFKISTFMYLPIELEIKLKDSKILIEENINFFESLNREKIKQIFTSIIDPYYQYLFITYGRQQGINVKIDILENQEKLKNIIENSLSEEEYYRYFPNKMDENIFDIAKLTEEEKNIYIRKGGYSHFFDFDMIDEKYRRYNHLSHGEQMIFAQLLNIYFYSKTKTNLIFLFDEPEIALHPEWQKKYLNEVITLLNLLKKNYHFIFTTHSPFLISDLPKENIIFLEKDNKTGECINTTKIVKINSFGANIHTLLSHGFFMKDGLMGEFAKDKINTIIKNLANKDYKITSKERKQLLLTINRIGEEFLKSKLLDMYYKKFDDEFTKKQRIEELKREQKKIQQELERYD